MFEKYIPIQSVKQKCTKAKPGNLMSRVRTKLHTYALLSIGSWVFTPFVFADISRECQELFGQSELQLQEQVHSWLPSQKGIPVVLMPERDSYEGYEFQLECERQRAQYQHNYAITEYRKIKEGLDSVNKQIEEIAERRNAVGAGYSDAVHKLNVLEHDKAAADNKFRLLTERLERAQGKVDEERLRYVRDKASARRAYNKFIPSEFEFVNEALEQAFYPDEFQARFLTGEANWDNISVIFDSANLQYRLRNDPYNMPSTNGFDRDYSDARWPSVVEALKEWSGYSHVAGGKYRSRLEKENDSVGTIYYFVTQSETVTGFQQTTRHYIPSYAYIEVFAMPNGHRQYIAAYLTAEALGPFRDILKSYVLRAYKYYGTVREIETNTHYIEQAYPEFIEYFTEKSSGLNERIEQASIELEALAEQAIQLNEQADSIYAKVWPWEKVMFGLKSLRKELARVATSSAISELIDIDKVFISISVANEEVELTTYLETYAPPYSADRSYKFYIGVKGLGMDVLTAIHERNSRDAARNQLAELYRFVESSLGGFEHFNSVSGHLAGDLPFEIKVTAFDNYQCSSLVETSNCPDLLVARGKLGQHVFNISSGTSTNNREREALKKVFERQLKQLAPVTSQYSIGEGELVIFPEDETQTPTNMIGGEYHIFELNEGFVSVYKIAHRGRWHVSSEMADIAQLESATLEAIRNWIERHRPMPTTSEIVDVTIDTTGHIIDEEGLAALVARIEAENAPPLLSEEYKSLLITAALAIKEDPQAFVNLLAETGSIAGVNLSQGFYDQWMENLNALSDVDEVVADIAYGMYNGVFEAGEWMAVGTLFLNNYLEQTTESQQLLDGALEDLKVKGADRLEKIYDALNRIEPLIEQSIDIYQSLPPHDRLAVGSYLTGRNLGVISGAVAVAVGTRSASTAITRYINRLQGHSQFLAKLQLFIAYAKAQGNIDFPISPMKGDLLHIEKQIAEAGYETEAMNLLLKVKKGEKEITAEDQEWVRLRTNAHSRYVRLAHKFNYQETRARFQRLGYDISLQQYDLLVAVEKHPEFKKPKSSLHAIGYIIDKADNNIPLLESDRALLERLASSKDDDLIGSIEVHHFVSDKRKGDNLISEIVDSIRILEKYDASLQNPINTRFLAGHGGQGSHDDEYFIELHKALLSIDEQAAGDLNSFYRLIDNLFADIARNPNKYALNILEDDICFVSSKMSVGNWSHCAMLH